MDFIHYLIKIYLISSLDLWVVLLVSTYSGVQFAGLKIILNFLRPFSSFKSFYNTVAFSTCS